MCTGLEIAALVGVAVSAAGAVAQGNAAKEAADDQARIRDEQAAADRERAGIEARRMRAEASKLAGQRRARLAASGVDTTSGTPLLVQSQADADAEFEALLTESQGARGASRLEQEAQATRKRGSNARTAGAISGVSTFITGASRNPGVQRTLG